MASFVGCGSAASSSSSWVQLKNLSRKKGMKNGKNNNRFKVSCVFSSVNDPYKTLRVHPGASEAEVKKAFRQLALQYHPDVCKGSNCDVQFYQINEAYDMVMSNLREDSIQPVMETYDEGLDDSFRGMHDPEWDLWEEWMGWEGAGIRDYTSHINPYI